MTPILRLKKRLEKKALAVQLKKKTLLANHASHDSQRVKFDSITKRGTVPDYCTEVSCSTYRRAGCVACTKIARGAVERAKAKSD
jgi:hypothetical protein